MKRMLWLLCLVVILLVSCARGEVEALSLLEELMESYGQLPEGQIYCQSAEEGLPSYLNDSQRRTLYGEKAEDAFPLMSDFAIYLSSRPMPLELAVFQCYSRTDAHFVAAMCMERGELLRVAFRGTAFDERGDCVRVLVKNRTVIMTVIPDLGEEGTPKEITEWW